MLTGPDNYFDSPPPPDGTMDIAIWLDAAMYQEEAAFVRQLVTGLKSEGQRVTFIAPHGVDLAALGTLGSRVCTYRWNRWERLGILQRMRLTGLIDELVARPPDVLVLWGTAETAPVEIVQEKAQLPAVVWCWDAPELFSPIFNSPYVKTAIVSSRPIAERAGKGAGMAGKVPVVHIPPGVYAGDTQACYDVPGQLPCLICLDPLSDLRAYEPLIHACRYIADEGLDFLLFAYDTGRLEHPIWQLAQRLHLLDRISFVPFQQEAEPLLLHGDLYLHVLSGSRVRYRTLDAMGRGLTVVTVNNPGADYLHDHQTCRIVPGDGGVPTEAAWRHVLMELLQDKQQAITLARKGQSYVREHHPMSRMLTQFITVCRQAAGTPLVLRG